MPDILRSVTLEEIIQAVDIVTEEEEEAKIREETKQQHWNVGTLEGDKGSVFLEGAANYLDDTWYAIHDLNIFALMYIEKLSNNTCIKEHLDIHFYSK